MALTEKEKSILDAQLKQISDRLTIERLSDKIPAIAQVRELNTELLRIMHHLRVIFIQRNNMQLVLNEDGKNNFGQSEDEALSDINQALNNVDVVCARWM